MGGRHKAPARHRRKKSGGGLLRALRRSDGQQDALPGAAPQQAPPQQAPPRQERPQPQPDLPPQPLRQASRQPGPAQPLQDPQSRRASWRVCAETAGLVVLVGALGALLTWANVIVDARETLVGGGLLLAPLLVRHVVLRVRRRWLALGAGYASLIVVGVGVVPTADLAIPHTVAGFGGTVLALLAGSTAFVLTSRVGARKQARPAATPGPRYRDRQPPAASVPPQQYPRAPSAPPPQQHPPAASEPPPQHAPAAEPRGDQETDTLPQVMPADQRDRRNQGGDARSA